MRSADPLLPDDTVSRYCRPGVYDRKRCELRVGAFQERETERCDYSINRLEHHAPLTGAAAVGRVRGEFITDGYRLERNGRFVVFNVSQVKNAAAHLGAKLSFIFTPRPPNASHSTIKGLPDPRTEEDMSLEVAAAIKRLVRRQDIHPAIA